MHSRALHLALLALIGLALFLPMIGNKHLWSTDEARYAEVAREMAESGNYLAPMLSGECEVSYPPLMYWLICLSAWLCGGFTEFSVTLPAALAAIGTVLVTYRIGEALWDRSTALLAGLLLLTLNGFAAAATLCRADMLSILFELLALQAFLKWYVERGRFPVFAFYMSLGFAVLSKGPQGLAVVLAIVFAFLVWERDLRRVRAMRVGWGALILLAITAPWYVAVKISTGADYLFTENLHVLLGSTAREDGHQRRPLYQYIPMFLGRSLPWALFFPSALIVLRRELKGARVRVDLFVIWVLVVVGLYSLAASKRHYYIALVYPAVALALAKFFSSRPGKTHTILPLGVLAAAISTGIVVVLAGPTQIFGFDIRANQELLLPLGGILLVCVGAAALRGVGVLVAALLLGYVGYAVGYYPRSIAEDYKKGQEVSRAINKAIGPNRKPVFFDCNWPHLAFYLRRTFSIARKLEEITPQEALVLPRSHLEKELQVLYETSLPFGLLSKDLVVVAVKRQ